ncbi:hypothetical protein [Cyclobacterium plantarum]|uniref:hypothetical protein n=1 Tax=Cyclobacterium plantarum TaxID=2716263 RepID=UPI003F717EA0
MTSQHLKAEESLHIITEMIKSTRYNISEDKIIYLMWGYAVALSGIIHYLLEFNLRYQRAWLVWISMPVIGIISGIYYSKKNKRARQKSFTDRALASLWISLVIGFFVLLFASPAIGWSGIYPVFMLLYGIGTATTGGIIKFRPLVIGGLLSMALSLFAFYIGFEYQLLLIALAVIVSYIIPGHLMPKAVKG